MPCWTESNFGALDEGRVRKRPRERVKSHEFLHSSCSVNSAESFHIADLCSLLPSKKVLFVGPETTFHLHANLLQALEIHENRSHSCLGSEFCTFHQICRAPRRNSLMSSEPFFPPGGFKKYPSNRELAASQSSILKYILSNSLYTGPDMRDARYSDPVAQVDPYTGVRQKEMYWLGQARKADLLVLHRSPLPAPAWTYDGTRRGDWSSVFPGDRLSGKEFGERILDYALRATVDRFLPETVATLNRLESLEKQRVLWHGSWYIEPTCVKHDARGKSVFDSDLDPWTLFYNAQGKMIHLSLS
ncbi:hypothetical protein BDP27DRAFT_566407 [Rhodocollybia butyracea]|uniref:Uncharacterized protein n=1 Tax=Rhodocollybia butyracea TaxID=206335 RepID=A0A9P5PZ06_9AGAR|nr:hypothetical protein BDP27DRAFT_566407 [Rhodocollybia butyracea]